MSAEESLLGESTIRQPAHATHASDFVVSVTTDLDAAIRLYQEMEADCISTAFQTRLWFECWVAKLARPKGVRALVCSVRSSEGHALMLLPLCLRTDGRLRVIEAADLGVTDYVAPVMAPAFRPTPAEWEQLWRRIVVALPPHDVLRLTKMPLDVGGRPNPLALIPGSFKLELQAHGVAVSAPWQACAAQIFSRNRREKLKKGWRALASLGDIRFRVVTDAAEMAPLFEQLAAQRMRRFAELQRNDPLRDQNFYDFYRAVIERGAGPGFARLTLIELGEQPVAMMFGVCHGDAFHLLIPTFFDGPWSQQAPGMLLAARAMQWAAEDGLRYFDFTIGNEDYKGRLGATAHDLFEVVSAGSWHGAPSVAALRLKVWIKRQPLFLAAIRRMQDLRRRSVTREFAEPS
jgi:CelD/BcsL family acetyltransferase involved in cellulose biosynthesis